ncbi:hypothetical protein CLV89_104138 [Tritonibacter scottomollicae]|uniref:Uncharacterized protein n=1 Tax=Tritonibacter scottomollicae TaxID=483013 RepID=A0A2T1AIA8_TRISK|nr:hypothetical protein CLV89_104138 [Tritonibacter scottomollicae]
MKVSAFGLGEITEPSLPGDVFQFNATGVYYARPASSLGAGDTPYQGNFHVWKSQRDEDFRTALLIAQGVRSLTHNWRQARLSSGSMGPFVSY